MGLELCKSCGLMHYQSDPCKESREGERIGAQAVHGLSGGDAVRLGVSAVSNKPSLDTLPAQAAKPLERVIPQEKAESDDTSMPTPLARSNTPKPKRDRTAYSATYMREVYRPRLKARRAAANG